jgi:hypothetical protein
MTDADSTRLEGYARRREGDLAGAAALFASAADQYRQAGESDDALTGLVDALCDKSEVLTGLGDPQSAAASAGEAVGVLRTRDMLGEGSVPSPQAARALLLLAMAELRVGDVAARDDMTAAVDMARRLTMALPTGENRAMLAMALNQQSTVALASGLPDDAAAAATEAVEIRRDLDESDPERFAGSLGSALNSLAAVQYEQQNIPAAAASAAEACSVLARAVEGGDMSAAGNLAAAKSNAAAFVGDLPDQLDLAVKFGVSAVEDYQRLVAANQPPAFVPEMAKAMLVLATCVAGQDRFDVAADLCRSAIVALLEHADKLSLPDLLNIPTFVQHYQAFAELGGTEVDPDLLAAANRAVSAA